MLEAGETSLLKIYTSFYLNNSDFAFHLNDVSCEVIACQELGSVNRFRREGPKGVEVHGVLMFGSFPSKDTSSLKTFTCHS